MNRTRTGRIRWLPAMELAVAFPVRALADEPQLEPLLTAAAAHRVMAAALGEMERREAPGGRIAILDDAGHLLLGKRLDGTNPGTPPVATGKARTAALFRSPTAKFEEIIRAERTPLLAIPDFVPMQGSIPLVTEGQIAAIGVGSAASAPQDQQVAIAGARALEAPQ